MSYGIIPEDLPKEPHISAEWCFTTGQIPLVLPDPAIAPDDENNDGQP